MPPSVSSGDRDAIVHQVRRCAAVETPTNCHGELEKIIKLECGPMPNMMAALPKKAGALCSTPQSLADAHYLTAVQ